jgi:hypothetical protein
MLIIHIFELIQYCLNIHFKYSRGSKFKKKQMMTSFIYFQYASWHLQEI